jgi:glycosyltransferase involved in cell wall biosynthesis
MKAHLLLASRNARLLLLCAVGLSSISIAVGVAIESRLLVMCGVLLAGSTTAVATKLMLEIRTDLTAFVTSSRSTSAALERSVNVKHGEVRVLDARVRELQRGMAPIGAAVQRLEVTADLLTGKVAALGTTAHESRSNAEQQSADIARLREDTAAVRDALVATRQLVDKLSARVPHGVSADRLAAASHARLAHPLLSIAVPSFNRPDALAECLASLESELRSTFDEIVEVCVVDDASPDPESLEIAVDFAERCPFASVSCQPRNVGIERNVIAACKAARGQYVLILGNDDKVIPGALSTVVSDLQTVHAPVHLYDKLRVTLEGAPRAPVVGSTPIDLPPGAAHLFPTLLEASSRQGLLSTFGFVSNVVFAREPFLAVDPSPYFDLTMYTHVFVLTEALGSQPVYYRNLPMVLHRTPTQPQKYVEALGRREERFMRGGESRSAGYFGTTLAAALQRLVDRGGVDHSFVAEQPENLMTSLPLVAWIAKNRRLDPLLDERIDSAIVADANRFLAEFDANVDVAT